MKSWPTPLTAATPWLICDYGFHHIHCPLEAYDVKLTVNIVASYCCGTATPLRRSGCWADYSYLCGGPFELHAVGRVGGRQRRQREHRDVLHQIMDHARHLGQVALKAATSAPSTAASPAPAKTPLPSRPSIPSRTSAAARTPSPLRHRRLRHFGRPLPLSGGRRGVRFRRSLGISLKGPFVDVPPTCPPLNPNFRFPSLLRRRRWAGLKQLRLDRGKLGPRAGLVGPAPLHERNEVRRRSLGHGRARLLVQDLHSELHRVEAAPWISPVSTSQMTSA